MTRFPRIVALAAVTLWCVAHGNTMSLASPTLASTSPAAPSPAAPARSGLGDPGPLKSLKVEQAAPP
ncbi:MAG TPA: hypothetical protein VMR25_07555, partial [Planctomycetaceae bacterium]|nr:hypothetical protein [Planctomycetaceae bacterium]